MDRERSTARSKGPSARVERAALDISLDDLWSLYGVDAILRSWTKAKKAIGRARARFKTEPERLRLIRRNERILSAHHGRDLSVGTGT